MCIHLSPPKGMGLGIIEPKRRGTHVPATAVLLQDDVKGTASEVKDEIVLVPQPSISLRDPLVVAFSQLHRSIGSHAYLLDRIGHCGRKISVFLPYASQSPSVVFKVPYCKQSMGFYNWNSRSRSQKLKIYYLTHHSRALSRVYVHRSWLV